MACDGCGPSPRWETLRLTQKPSPFNLVHGRRQDVFPRADRQVYCLARGPPEENGSCLYGHLLIRFVDLLTFQVFHVLVFPGNNFPLRTSKRNEGIGISQNSGYRYYQLLLSDMVAPLKTRAPL